MHRLQPAVREAVHKQTGELRADVVLLHAEVRALTAMGRVVGAAADLDGLLRSARPVTDTLDALTTNLELMKAELRGLASTVDKLGFAIAPGAGFAGVPARFAELRERLNSLDRRMRAIPTRTSHDEAAAPPTPGRTTSESPGAGGFDYVGFELRFRGDPESILAEQRARYFDLLAQRGPVLDLGCGRGELLAELAREGVAGVGVDLDAGMVAEARAAGVDVRVGDALDLLRNAEPATFGAVIAMHVVEHLQLPTLVELLELVASRLKPGGLFIAETPNPTTLLVLGNSYILDPTHVWPLHPSLLTFLCETAGFRDVRQRFYAPATAYELPLLEPAPDDPPWIAIMNESLTRLNQVLFGPQDYAVVATTPD